MNTNSYFKNHPTQKKIVLFLSSFCVLISFVAYLGINIYLIYTKQYSQLFKTILIPLTTIIMVEIIRKIYPKKRPFEVHQFEPLIEHSKGKSFPSKHATSAMIIALTIYQVSPLVGTLLIINAIFVGLTRILCGIHFPSDVLAGYLLAILMSCFYFI